MVFHPALPRALRPGTRNFFAAVGLALIVVWYDIGFRVAPLNPVSVPIPYFDRPRADVPWLVMLVAVGITSAILSRMPSWGGADASGPRRMPRPYAIASGAICAVGTALVQFAGDNVVAMVAGGLLAGVGLSMMATALVDALPRADRNALLEVCGTALVLAAIIKLLLKTLDPMFLYVAMWLLPITATVLGVRADMLPAGVASSNKQFPQHDEQIARHFATVVFCFVGLGFLLGVVGFENDSLSVEDHIALQLLWNAPSALLACGFLIVTSRISINGPFLIAPVLLASAALVFLASNAGGGDPYLLAHILAKSVDEFVVVLAVIVMVELRDSSAARRRSPSFVPMASAFSMLIGIILAGVLMTLVGLTVASAVLIAIALIFGALLAMGTLALRQEREAYVVVRNAEDVARIANAQADCIAHDVETLTPREVEVMALLLQHRSAPAIAELLGISQNTVRTHITHIYKKVGVDGVQGLYSVAENKTLSH